MAADRAEEREAMVRTQLAARGIDDATVLEAMTTIARELFVPPERAHEAYGDHAVSLAAGQTISQPWIVAAIAQALTIAPGERVLEVGTGSGYSTAVLAALGAEVISVERLAELTAAARENLREAGVEGVELVTGDGSIGLPEAAPFDAIAVHAAIPTEPQELLAQLAPGGRLVAPIAVRADPGSDASEYLVRWIRRDRGSGEGVLGEPEGRRFARQTIAPCRFVPLIGAAGYPDRA